MLNSAILPHHTKWFQLFEQLRVIVIDELHTYRGVFGSHVANVLRRLLRLCAHYGSHPVIVCCSATIGNPGELASMLTGRPMRLIDRNGAPSGERHVLLVDPPVIDAATGARGSAVTLAQPLGAAVPAGRPPDDRVRALAGRRRDPAHRACARRCARAIGPRSKVRGYRGGYLPTERRSIERGLRDGEILGVVSTNALELGVDIGRLDVAILAGYPGSIAATWQQIGRAGRRLGHERRGPRRVGRAGRPVRHPPPGVPARRPAGGGPPRPGQPPRPARPPAGGDVRAAVRAGRGVRSGAGRRPARVPRGGGPRPPGRRRALVLELGELPGLGDLAAGGGAGERRDHRHDAGPAAGPRRGRPVLGPGPRPRAGDLHPRVAVQYYVDRLEWGERKAYVHRIDVDHYTYANRAVTLKPLDVFAEAPATGGRRIHGEVMVASLVTLFKKLKFVTDENVGWGPIDLPELELQTTAYWVTAEGPAGHWRRDDLDVALLGAGRAIQTVASVLLMVDPRDLGLVTQVRSPHQEAPTIYLYEAMPGGVGLSRAALGPPRRAASPAPPSSSPPAAARAAARPARDRASNRSRRPGARPPAARRARRPGRAAAA